MPSYEPSGGIGRPHTALDSREEKLMPANSSALAAVASAILASASAATLAQTSFTEVTPQAPLFSTPEEEDFWINSVAPADVDGDGDLDLAVIGFYVVYFVSVE